MEDAKVDEFFSRPPKMNRWQRLRLFFWDADSKEFLSRTGKSWFQILGFYVLLYSFIVGFFGIMLVVFFQTLDVQKPRWQLGSGLIGDSPGMGFRPRPRKGEVILDFDKNDPQTFQDYVESVDKFLSTYEQGGDALVDCDYGTRVPEGKVCRFPASENIPAECSRENGYGFADGSPCVFLKVNNVYGWEPQNLTTEQILELDMPDRLKERIGQLDQRTQEGNVWVSCQVDDGAGVNVTYGVGDLFGLPNYFFPFVNVDGYQSPFVVVRLIDVPEEPLKVVCRLWAKNVQFDRQYRRGMALIELHSRS